MSVFSLDTSTKLAQAACDRRKDQFSTSLPLSPPSDSETESSDSQSFGVTHILEFSMPVKVWGQPEKKPIVWDLSEIKPVWNWAVMLHRGICSFTVITHQWVLLRATLSICAEALWLSWEVVIDAFCLSDIIFYFIDLFSVLNKRGVPKIPFSNILPQEVGSLKCNTFWDDRAHKPPLSFLSDLYSSFLSRYSEDVVFHSLQCQ